MRNFILRVIINALAIAAIANLLDGIHVTDDSISTLLLLCLVFGIVNALLRPILTFLTCPAMILTLGLFTMVINGLLIQITAWLVGDRMTVDNLGWAILAGIIMGLISMVLESVLGVNGDEDDKKKKRDR